MCLFLYMFMYMYIHVSRVSLRLVSLLDTSWSNHCTCVCYICTTRYIFLVHVCRHDVSILHLMSTFLGFRLRNDGSNLIKDRKYHLTTYKQAFVGREFVDWLISRGEASSRIEAVDIGKQLLDAGVFRHGRMC